MCGLIAPFVFVPIVYVAGIETPGYSQIRSTFSDSAAQGQPHPEIIGVGLILVAILLVGYARGLDVVLPRYQAAARFAMLGGAISIGATGIFQDHNRSPNVPRNLEGYSHNFFAMTAIFSIIAAAIIIDRAIAGQAGWTHLRWPGIATMVLLTFSGSGFYVVGDNHDGLLERAFSTVAFSWLVLVAGNAIWLLVHVPAALPSITTEAIHDQIPVTSESGLER
jgi:hypothetical membrane protein